MLLISVVQFVDARWFAGFVAAVPRLSELGGFAFRNAPLPIFIIGVAMYSMNSYTSIFLQVVRGYSAIETGLVFTAATIVRRSPAMG